ncbi:CCXG family PEP-CTERM protein [Psychromonas sp. MME2]|uniref:CCXG family PEP-CTERM protein n=1 Tax=unclassified Psychromonas TaxID=2614957 RepID=UPI00339BC16D
MNISKVFSTAIFATTMVISANASASLMTVATRTIDNAAMIDSSDFISSWNSQSSTVTTNAIDAFELYKTGNNTINHFSVDFTIGATGTWGVEAGLDAHYGAALYLDGLLLTNRSDDLWWSTDWANSDVMKAHDIDISVGSHLLEIYWAESCCNGPSTVRFTNDGQNWDVMSKESIAAAVPAPSALAIFGIGLIGFGLRRKNNNA